MKIALGAALLVCAAVLLIYHLRVRKTMNTLDRMLGEAVRGDFEVESYNETELSKIESKLSRFLSASKLKRGQIEHEQDKIRSLISDISHQTKTPIANVLLYTQLLCERDLPEDTKELAGQIIAGAEKLDFLIQSLIKTSRLESGIIKVMPQRSDVRELILSSLDDCAPRAREKGVSLAADSLVDPVFARFDPKWCKEALHNIIDNAVKYTEAGGRVNIYVRRYEMFICIDVRDTGRGIRDEDLPRVYGRFWRADSESEGVGIGLYLSREIISACGGYIKAASTVGVGSVFSVFLPSA